MTTLESNMSLQSYRSGLPAVLVVRHLRLQGVHIRLHVEDPGFECSEGLEQIHGGVDEHFCPDRSVLTLPQVAQRCHAFPDALRLAGDRVDTLPRALEGKFELVQRVPQRGQQVPRLVRLRHTLSLLAQLSTVRPSCLKSRSKLKQAMSSSSL